MEELDYSKLAEFVNSRIVDFHNSKLDRLKKINLSTVLKKKNPYLFSAKNITVASDLVKEILDAYLSASEEKLFGDFLEDLALFVAEMTCAGKKSAATGIDLEFIENSIYHLVSIKSGPNWGNSSQQRKQQSDFQTAVKVLKQSKRSLNVQPVLGICYGKSKDSYNKGYLKVVGQSFWYFISKNKELYTDIIEPIKYRAKHHNDEFKKRKSQIINLFTDEFLERFCTNGVINWKELVEFNSGNLAKK